MKALVNKKIANIVENSKSSENNIKHRYGDPGKPMKQTCSTVKTWRDLTLSIPR